MIKNLKNGLKLSPNIGLFFLFREIYKPYYEETVDCAPAKIGRSLEIVGSNPTLFLFCFTKKLEGCEEK